MKASVVINVNFIMNINILLAITYMQVAYSISSSPIMITAVTILTRQNIPSVSDETYIIACEQRFHITTTELKCM